MDEKERGKLQGAGGEIVGEPKPLRFHNSAHCCFYMTVKIHSLKYGLPKKPINLLALSLHCFFSSIHPSIWGSKSSVSLPYPSAYGVWTVRVTVRINNRQITAQSSSFKHSLKSHQPRREANEERGGGEVERRSGSLATNKATLQQQQQQQPQQCSVGKIHAQ